MTNSVTTMNEDVILEIMSYCPATEIGKLRLLNKECNKRSYELSFINRHLERTNSVFGYFIHYLRWCKNKTCFVISGGKEESSPISLYSFLPRRTDAAAKIEAWDTHHGILLCVDDTRKGGKRIPDYIVCKPATKQYQIIPNPKTRWGTIATGLMVISSNPFRYKIIRLSGSWSGWRRDGIYHDFLEVFDSDLFAWRRRKNTLKSTEFCLSDDKPVSAYGCLHWLTKENNVIRFCMRTETWSSFPIPDEFTCDRNPILVTYEGKLGVIHSRWGEESNTWVLDKSFGKSWVIVKSAKITAFEDDRAQPVWFPSNDVVSIASRGRLGLYNMSRNKYRNLRERGIWEVFPGGLPRDYVIPFYSNYDRVCLKRDDVEETGRKRLEEH